MYRQSNDNGATWGAASIIAAPTNAKATFQNNFGWGVFHQGEPYVYWNGHNSAYTYYQTMLKSCAGC